MIIAVDRHICCLVSVALWILSVFSVFGRGGGESQSLASLRSVQSLLEEKKFPIVYFYTLDTNACKRGLPNYLLDSINQAIETQIDCCEVKLMPILCPLIH